MISIIVPHCILDSVSNNHKFPSRLYKMAVTGNGTKISDENIQISQE